MYQELMKEYEEAFANEWNEPLSDEARKAVLDFVVWANSERRLTLRGARVDIPKACTADHDEQIAMLNANYCHECGERLSS